MARNRAATAWLLCLLAATTAPRTQLQTPAAGAATPEPPMADEKGGLCDAASTAVACCKALLAEQNAKDAGGDAAATDGTARAGTVLDSEEGDDEARPNAPIGGRIVSPLAKLQMDLDRNRMMHRLAAQYFDFQNFWLLFVPSIVVTMVSGVLANLSDGGSLPLPEWFQTIASTSVGVLAIVSVFIQAVSKELDYSHRAKEHEDASVELRTLYDKIKFTEHDAVARSSSSSYAGFSISDVVRDFEEQYEQIMAGCKSPLPTEIYNAYELVSSRLELAIFPPVELLFPHDDDLSKSKVDWISAIGIVNNEVFNAFGTHWLWPWRMPTAEPVVEKAFASIHRLLRTNQEDQHPSATENVYGLLLGQQRGIKLANMKVTEEDSKGESECVAKTSVAPPNA